MDKPSKEEYPYHIVCKEHGAVVGYIDHEPEMGDLMKAKHCLDRDGNQIQTGDPANCPGGKFQPHNYMTVHRDEPKPEPSNPHVYENEWFAWFLVTTRSGETAWLETVKHVRIYQHIGQRIDYYEKLTK